MSVVSLTNRYKNKRRSKRLQKKLHLNEFQEMGFDVDIKFKEEITQKQKDNFFKRFIEECVEANKLTLGGTCESFFICKVNGSCTEEDRVLLDNYITKSPEVSEVDVYTLIDAWYGPFSD